MLNDAVESSPYQMNGLRAVVTGSSSGIGRAIALEFARAGSVVAVHANKSMQEAEGLAHKLRTLGTESVVFQADLSRENECRRLVHQCSDTLGQIDVWVNNAGADILTSEDAKRSYVDKLKLLVELDLRATILLTKGVADTMGSSGGTIINIGWDQAEAGMEGDDAELFSAVKGGVMAFTRSAALSLAPRIRVNCIAPGWIKTAWGDQASDRWQERVRRETPLERWGTPQDVAHAALFLASPAASYITGQVIRVNGGAVR